MKPLNPIQVLQFSIAAVATSAVLLRAIFSGVTFAHLFHFLKASPIPTLSITWCALIFFLHNFVLSKPKPIFLVDYSCYKPTPDRKCSYQVSENFVRGGRFSTESVEFMRKIYLKSGLGNETYGPPFVFQENQNHDPSKLDSAMTEAQEGIFGSIDLLLKKTLIDPSVIDTLIVTSGGFTPVPSLASLVINRYNLKTDVKTYNLSGMGCSAGVLSIDLAAAVLGCSKNTRFALVVATENISLNWYFGDNRSMLVTNCIFRVGCAAALVTNDPSYSRVAKFQLVHSLRTHHGDDRAYRAAFEEEDENGIHGVALTKDLIQVAGSNLREHIRKLAPHVLPLSQLASYVYSVVFKFFTLSRGDDVKKPIVPDFTTAFDHFCIHTGGKAVIEQVGRVLRLSEGATEPARMCLHRFGNTSSSLVLYELAYFEAKKRVKKGDKIWMLAFGTGFKVGSLVWKSLRGYSGEDTDNPWNDCIHKYPVKSEEMEQHC